jgi:hypothetical protein
MQILPTISSWSSNTIEADKAILIRGGVLIPDLIEDRAFVEFRQILCKIELWELLYVGGVFCSPPISSFQSFLAPCLAIRGVGRF